MLAIALGTGTTAHGATGWAACQGGGAVDIHPGLTNEPHDATITGHATFDRCASSDPSVTSGSLTISGRGTELTCAQPSPVFGVGVMTWSNGTMSVIDFTTKGAAALGTVTGVITSGSEFVGTIFSAVAIFTGDLSKCGTAEGLTTAGFEEVNSFA
jgi:hypothetical protein